LKAVDPVEGSKLTPSTRRLHVALLGASIAALTWLIAPGTVAYIGQNPYDVHLDGPSGTVPCARDIEITATVKSATNGDRVAHQVVKWDIKKSPSSGDRLSSGSTTTNSDGKTSVTLSFGSAEGERQVRATVATFPATLTIQCEGPFGARPTATPEPRSTPRPTSRPGPVVTSPPHRQPTPAPSGIPVTSTTVIPAEPSGPDGPDLRFVLVLVFVGTGLGVLVRRSAR
jgi:hypothetical protein